LLDRLAKSAILRAMKTWTLSAAKNQLSKVAEKAVREGPQKITRAGKAPVVLISYDELQKMTPGAVEKFFRSAPPSMDELAEAVAQLRE